MYQFSEGQTVYFLTEDTGEILRGSVDSVDPTSGTAEVVNRFTGIQRLNLSSLYPTMAACAAAGDRDDEPAQTEKPDAPEIPFIPYDAICKASELTTDTGRIVRTYRSYGNGNEEAPATAGQIKILDKYRIEYPGDILRGEASWYIDRLPSPMSQASAKQRDALKRFGFLLADLWTGKEASAVLTRIAENHWNLPPDLNIEHVPARLAG